MLQSWKNWCWKLALKTSLTISGAIIALPGNYAPAQSQIVPDSTLGAERSVVKPNVNIDGIPGNQINGGAIRGTNLFHSFEQFSVSTGSAAHFNNAPDIQNIISRVTGSSISNIDGLLKANRTANLFLLNPNGIVFGPNASLNIGGSFLGSTASSLNFDDGNQFSATEPQSPSLLKVSVPIGLQFGGGEGRILNQSVAVDDSSIPVGLEVPTGKTLALVGGDVVLERGNLTAAEAGRIELGSVAGPALVSLSPTPQGWTLGYEDVQNFKDIQLSQGALVNASGSDIQVQGRRVTLTNGGQIGTFATSSRSGGTLTVNASDSVKLTGFITTANGQFRSSLRTDTGGSNAAGDLRINTGKLIVQDRAFVSAFSQGTGKAGNLEVAARSILLDDRAALTALSILGNDGGNIILRVQDLLLLRRNSRISTNTGTASDGGNDGNIIIDAPIIVAVPSENSDITANAFEGQGGNVQITAQGIFGTKFVEQQTLESDINASGNVRLYTPPDVDPNRGLVALPAELVEVAGLIVQGCQGVGGTGDSEASEFIITGRGGLPPTPREALGSEPALVDLGTFVPGQENRANAATSINPTDSEPVPLVEAQGWVIGSNGEVVLTAQAPNVTPQSPWLTPTNCYGS